MINNETFVVKKKKKKVGKVKLCIKWVSAKNSIVGFGVDKT